MMLNKEYEQKKLEILTKILNSNLQIEDINKISNLIDKLIFENKQLEKQLKRKNDLIDEIRDNCIVVQGGTDNYYIKSFMKIIKIIDKEKIK